MNQHLFAVCQFDSEGHPDTNHPARPQQSSDLRILKETHTRPVCYRHSLFDRSVFDHVSRHGHSGIPLLRFEDPGQCIEQLSI